MIDVNCEMCNKLFKAYPCEVKTRHKVTCSKECRILKNKIGINNGKYKLGHVKCGGFVKGDKHSSETLLKMSLVHKGQPNKFKGVSIKFNDALRKWRLEGGAPWNKGLIGVFVKEKAANWHGGKSFEPYSLEFDSSLRESIRLREGYKCKECGVSQLESGRQLCVHHIDFNKLNNSTSNLIAICLRCHAKTCSAKDRNKWILYYQEKMNNIWSIK